MKDTNTEVIITVFTPTFNRSSKLERLFNSLVDQSFSAFEWIVVNDGSTDNTDDVICELINQNKINIKYIKQENSGKHIAMNRAVEQARGYFFTVVDSDDYLPENSLEVLYKSWLEIPEEEWKNYSAIKSDCFDATTKEKLGPVFSGGELVCSYLDARYRYKVNYEMQSMTRTSVLKEFPNPEILGGPQNGGLRFYPESIWQEQASRKYLTKFIDVCTYAYTTDSSESLLGRGKKYDRYRENIFLWLHIVNDTIDYFWYSPKHFIKAFVGISMDGMLNGLKMREVFSKVNSKWKRVVVLLLSPIGYCLYLKMRS